MDIIKKYIYFFFNFLKQYKLKWLIFFVSFIFFIIILFPYDIGVFRLENEFRKRTSHIHITYDEFYISLLGPSLIIENPQILIKDNQVIKAKKLRLRLSYLSFLQFKPALLASLYWPQSKINVKIQRQKAEQNLWKILLKSNKFVVSDLSSISPILSKIKGNLNFNLQLTIDPSFSVAPQIQWSISSQSIHIQEPGYYTFPGYIGTIYFPILKWSTLKFDGEIKENKARIKDLILGQKTDELQIHSRGIMDIQFIKLSVNKKTSLRIQNYNLALNIFIAQNLQSQFEFLDLLFGSQFQKISGRGNKYLMQAKGRNISTFLTTLEPISHFPSLDELKK